MMINEARRAGDFRKADAYRGIATSAAIDWVVDAISLGSSVIDMAAGGALFDGAAENAAEAAGQAARTQGQVLDDALKEITEGMIGGASGVSLDGKKWLDNGWIRQMAGPASRIFKAFADPMTQTAGQDGLIGGGFIDPGEVDISGAGGDTLRAARTQSDQYFTEIYTRVSGNDPRFTQKAVNEAIDPPDMTLLQGFESILKPSFYVTTVRDLMIGAPDGIADGLASDQANRLDTLASTLEGMGWLVDKLDEFTSAQWGAGLDEIFEQVSESMRQNDISLQFARDSVSTVEDFMKTIDDFANDGGMLDNLLGGAEGLLEQLKLSPEKIGLPDWAPEWMFQWAFDIFNVFLDQMKGGVGWVNDLFRPILDEFIETQTAKAQRHLDDISEVIREGGEVELFLQASYDTVMEGLATFTDAVGRWVTQDWDAQATELRNRASQLREDRVINRAERFRAWVATYGQGQVDAWKGTYGGDVEEGYKPHVPAWEIDAVTRVHQMIMDRCDELEQEAALFQPYNDRYRSMADEEKAACDGLSSGQGQGNLEEFWRHADRLAEVAANVGL